MSINLLSNLFITCFIIIIKQNFMNGILLYSDVYDGTNNSIDADEDGGICF